MSSALRRVSGLAAMGFMCAAVVAAQAADAPRALRVAVLTFDSVSEDPELASLGSGLQAMLTTDLAVAPQLKLVERDKLQALQTELKLQASQAIDRATAVKVGKLLGATHLLSGAITVAGNAMRIDARLVDAGTGEVVLSDKVEGDKALFFELEKALAQKLVAALGTPLTPKERARLARIHTADFDAFRRFSDGITAFDHRAFDDARKALRDALERDEEFQLARLTLDDYEAIISKLDARKDLLEAGERQQKLDARTAKAAEQKLILGRLFELAQSKDPMERAPALFGLVRWHDYGYRDRLELHRVGDEFLLARLCDRFAQAYVAEAEKLFPKVPLYGTADFIGDPPYEAAKFESEQKEWLERFFGTSARNTEAYYKQELLEDIERGISSRELARHLHLDVREEARFAEKAYKAGVKLDPDAVDAFYDRKRTWRSSVAESLGRRFGEAGMFDESTRWFAEAGRLANDPGRTQSAAQSVEKNRDLVKLLATHPSPRVREWLMLRGFDLPDPRYDDDTLKALGEKKLSPRARAALANRRSLRANRDNPYIILGDRPLFPSNESHTFATGKRTDPLVASDLDYFRRNSRDAAVEWSEAYFAGEHKGQLTARFALAYGIDDEWWDDGLSSTEDLSKVTELGVRPEVLFIFGAVDLLVPTEKEGERHVDAYRLQRGMRAYGLHITKDRIALVRVIEPEERRGLSVARDRFTLEVLDSDEGTIADGAKVVVTLRGRDVEAKVGGLDVDKTLPEAPAGFTGFAMLGPGHVRVVAPVVTIPH